MEDLVSTSVGFLSQAKVRVSVVLDPLVFIKRGFETTRCDMGASGGLDVKTPPTLVTVRRIKSTVRVRMNVR